MDFFFSWSFLLFALAISAMTQGVRTTVEYFCPMNKLWNKLLLPNLPVVLGMFLAVVCAKFAFPVEVTAFSTKVLFGAVAGLLSGHSFRMISNALEHKFESTAVDPAAPVAPVSAIQAHNE